MRDKMFEVENKEKLRIINAETLDPVTDWEEATKEGFYKLLKSITGLFFSPTQRTLDLIKNIYDMGSKNPFYIDLYSQNKPYCVESNQKGFVPVYNLPGVYYDHEKWRCELDISTFNTPYLRKKNLREKDSGYRRDPVSLTGRRRIRVSLRDVSYKGTLLAYDNPDCKEYGIKGYRKRKVVYKWDLEPWRNQQRCWKSQGRRKKQWERG